jgi:succinate-semialdehyde dehydrogenase/glutarate-semialdehyde dehydrogenase
MVTSVATVAADLIRSSAFVDGRWVDADGGETFPVVNPATGETIVEVPRLGTSETRRAIEAAERALPAWKARTAKERARILTRLATLMASRVRRSPTRSPSTSGSPSRRSGSTAPSSRRPRPTGASW